MVPEWLLWLVLQGKRLMAWGLGLTAGMSAGLSREGRQGRSKLMYGSVPL